MSSEVYFYGLNFQELVLFAILVYVAAIILVIVFARCIRHRLFCPYSGEGIHCQYFNAPFACPNCFLRRSTKSAICCRRNHSVYNQDGVDFSKCKFKCFRPDCKHCRCCCCECLVEQEDDNIEKTIKIIEV